MSWSQSYLMFLLVLVRIASYMVTMPVFSIRQIPSLVKLGLVVAMTLFTAPNLPPLGIEVNSILTLGMIVLQEALLGLMMGYTSTIIFLGIQSAGDLIDFTAGVKMASSYDPISGTSSSLYSSLYNWLGVILFINMNGHHYLFKGIVNSFYVFEVGTEYINSFKLESLIYLISRSFLIAIQLALPIGIILFLIDLILGIISKIIPQMNVLILGMSFKIGASFLIHLLVIAGIIQSISWALESVITILDYFIKSLGGGG